MRHINPRRHVTAMLVALSMSIVSIGNVPATAASTDVGAMGRAVPSYSAGCTFDSALGLTASGSVSGLRTGAIQGVVFQWENLTSQSRSVQEFPYNVDATSGTKTFSARTASTWAASFQLVASGGENNVTNVSGDTVRLDFKVSTAKGIVTTLATCVIP